jgi:iron(III) transport system substrate-binding protein
MRLGGRGFLPALAFLLSCGRSPSGEVVVYTSVDDLYAQEIFAAFTRESGVVVKPVFDTEEAKTLGLVHRIVAERAHPQADVFWNGECARTALLKEKGLLEPYRPPTGESIGAEWRDPADAWVGFGARARVIVYNTARVKEPPQSIDDLADPRWRGRIAMANPLFGTTAAHVAALAQTRGEGETLKLLESLKANGIRFVGGNSHVRDLVAKGECDAGLTDTDDVWLGKAHGDPIDLVYPDQKGAGTLVIPNTAALIKGAPHAVQARKFLDYLLRAETEALLARGSSRQLPVRPGLASPDVTTLRRMKVDWSRIAAGEGLIEKVRTSLGL